jgi:hypothetical protein
MRISLLRLGVVVILSNAFVVSAKTNSLRRQNAELDQMDAMTSGDGRRLQQTSKNKVNVTVGAYYYPWHGENFNNEEGFLRAQLNPKQRPELGEYDDTKKKTIETHLEFSDMGKIDLWVTSWWGPDQITDTTTQNTIMKQVEKEENPLKIALLYESTNRLRVDGEWQLDVDRIETDMEYITKEYFDHFDNYFRIDGKPVLFIYLTRVLQSEGGNHEDGKTLLQQTIELMKEKAKQDIFIVGDHAFDAYPEDVMSSTAALHNSSLKVLDGITNCKFLEDVAWMHTQVGCLVLSISAFKADCFPKFLAFRRHLWVDGRPTHQQLPRH